MKRLIPDNTGLSHVILILIAIGVMAASSGTYFLTHRSKLTQQTLITNSPNPEQSQNTEISESSAPSQSRNTEISEENNQINKDLILELELSSLSRIKGAADIYWNIPGGFATGKHERIIASPLDLVDGIKITNNTNETVTLSEINNESRDLFITPPSDGVATPIILLPEKFIKNENEEVPCKGRDLFSNSINNICIFETPINISPKGTITLRPQLFAVRGSDWNWDNKNTRDEISFIGNKEDENVFTVTTKNNGRYILLSDTFEEYDKTSDSITYNIGGLILINSKDKNLINKTFLFKTANGEKIFADVTTKTGLNIKSFALPYKGFSVENNKFHEDVITLQIFLYKNGFINRADINGEYDDKTITAIKQFQKKAGVIETGKPDDATIFVTRARGFLTGISLYENYGDEEVTISPDSPQPYFRLFSIGTDSVDINKDFSDSSLIEKVVWGCEDHECASFAFTLDNRAIFTLQSITILNNTTETQTCTLTNSNKIQIKNFQVATNGTYQQKTNIDGITKPEIHHLKCGDKSLDIELFPNTPLN